jgi:hypothetical protein
VVNRAGLAVALGSALLACSETGAALTYSVLSTCIRVEQPTERVFRTAEEWRAFAEPRAARPVPVPDFGQVMIAAHFDGTGSACVGFTVESVEERADEVVVNATRHTSADPCIAVIAYPQLVLSIERRDLPVRFRVRDVTDRTPGAIPACT